MNQKEHSNLTWIKWTAEIVNQEYQGKLGDFLMVANAT